MKHPFYTLYYTGMSVLVFTTIFFVSLILNLKRLMPADKTEKNYVDNQVIESDNAVSVLSTTSSINIPKEIVPVKGNTKTNTAVPKTSTVHDTVHVTVHDTVNKLSPKSVTKDTNSSKIP